MGVWDWYVHLRHEGGGEETYFIHLKGREGGEKERGRREGERGLENQSTPNFKSESFHMYLQFDTVGPLYNSDVENLTKLNGEISIESAGVCVWGGV